MTKKLSGKGFFSVRKGALLLTRIGPASGQIQRHFYKPVNIQGEVQEDIEAWKNSIRRPPTRKGIFTFPSPMDDAFYYAHVYERMLPKKFLNWEVWNKNRSEFETDEEFNLFYEEREKFYDERAAKMKEIIQRVKKKKIWHSGIFYSHICPKGLIDDGRSWWKYDNAAEWISAARKYIWEHYGWRDLQGNNMYGGRIWVDPGHFEIFIPD